MNPLLLSVALAGEPLPGRCEAVFMGPVEECSLPGSWVASGFGRTESQARRHALARLSDALQFGAAARAAKATDTVAQPGADAEVRSCPRVGADAARVHCYPAAELVETRLCFASFEAPDCWPGDMLDLEGVAWKMMESGRDNVCRSLAASLTGASEEQQASCQARCQQQARVRCPR